MNDGIRISIVIVLFQPPPDFISFLDRLLSTGCQVVIVVNGVDDAVGAQLRDRLDRELIVNDGNAGLARALNQGCEYAFAHGATHVFLLDQDSRPSPDLARFLAEDAQAYVQTGKRLAAIGPVLVDEKRPDARVGALGVSAENFVRCNSLATSGTLIPKEAFEQVGPMDEWLFIDCIDHEWCFRAQGKGYDVIVSRTREMSHNMGDAGISLFGIYKPIHRSPLRHGFIVRNTVYLVRQAYAPSAWRLSETLKLAYRIPVYLLVSRDRIDTMRRMARGIVAGLSRRRHA